MYVYIADAPVAVVWWGNGSKCTAQNPLPLASTQSVVGSSLLPTALLEASLTLSFSSAKGGTITARGLRGKRSRSTRDVSLTVDGENGLQRQNTGRSYRVRECNL